MDPSSSCTSEDNEHRALQILLDAFGPVCSLEEIATAYCKAGRDVSKAGDLLYKFQEINCDRVSHAQSELSLNGDSTVSSSLPKNVKGSRQKKFTASSGTVSSYLDKTYTRPISSSNESSGTTKPLKLEVNKSMMDDLEMNSAVSDIDIATRKDQLSNRDVEEFLFSMLGDGFKLGMDVVRDVLGHCGYDVKKSMEELLAVSVNTLKKGKAIDSDMAEEFTDPQIVSSFSEENSRQPAKRNVAESNTMEKENSDKPREVLEALFKSSERASDEPKRKQLQWGLNRTRVPGQRVVTKPFDDIYLPPLTVIPKMRHDNNDDFDVEDEYHVLRKTVRSHWDAMKANYIAAVDAFNNGDQKQANELLEQGKYYYRMAREADEKSSGEILDTSKSHIQDNIPLDLHAQNAKEAVRMLKLHLHNLANISSFRYLKVIVDTDAEDATKGKRKRLVNKLLERESIQWTEEEEEPGTIYIQLDLIDPKKLSFVKNSE